MNLQAISNQTIERYSLRYQNLGYHIRTLGWGTVEQQTYRFAQTIEAGIDLSGKKLVDLGCGFGDYVDFLDTAGVDYISYHGVDINPDLIKEAQNRHVRHHKAEFSVGDLHEPCMGAVGPSGDVGIMLGLLNFNLGEKMDNYQYAKQMIINAMRLVHEGLIVDFISDRRDKNYPREDGIFYYSPSKMMEIVVELSDNFVLKHDYLPIPQKEFMLTIWK